MSEPLPPLVVLPHRAVLGVEWVGDGLVPLDKHGRVAPGGRLLDGREALETVYETDAHCVAYSIEGEDPHPRINKRALEQLQEFGMEPLLRWAIVDVDNEKHARWSCQSEAETELTRAVSTLEAAALPRPMRYTTRSGYRLLWPLLEPLPVLDGERHLWGLVQKLRALGLNADEACTDWTSLFRLPRVVRDGIQEDSLPLFDGDWLDLRAIPPKPKTRRRTRKAPQEPFSTEERSPRVEAFLVSLQQGLERVRTAPQGERNSTFNAVAYHVGQRAAPLFEAAELDEIEDRLEDAAITATPEDEGKIRSNRGFRDGLESPIDILGSRYVSPYEDNTVAVSLEEGRARLREALDELESWAREQRQAGVTNPTIAFRASCGIGKTHATLDYLERRAADPTFRAIFTTPNVGKRQEIAALLRSRGVDAVEKEARSDNPGSETH